MDFLIYFCCRPARVLPLYAPFVERDLGLSGRFWCCARLHGASGTPPPTNEQTDCDYCKVFWRGQVSSLQYQWQKERRGEQCSPVQFSGNVGPRVLAPTATVHWLPSRGAPTDRRVRGGPTGMGILPATPQSPSVTAPLKGSHPLRPLFWPRRGQSEKK